MTATVFPLTNPVCSLPEPSRHLARACRNIRQASGDFTEAPRDIRQPHSQVGTVPRSVRNSDSASGIAVRNVPNSSFPSGIAVLRLFIHIRPLGTAPGQPKETCSPLPIAPPDLPDTYPTGGRPSRPLSDELPVAAPSLSLHRMRGEGRGEGLRAMAQAAAPLIRPSATFSPPPRKGEGVRSLPQIHSRPHGRQTRPIPFSFFLFPFTFPRLLPP